MIETKALTKTYRDKKRGEIHLNPMHPPLVKELCALPLLAQDKYVLVTSPSKVQEVCGRHGLTQVTQLSSHGVFLVSTFSVDPTIATDSSVQSFEANRPLGVPELRGLPLPLCGRR